MLRRRNPVALVLATALALGCAKAGESRLDPARTATATAAPPPPATPAPSPRVLLDFVDALPSCDVDHRGPLLDAGTGAMIGRFGWVRGVPEGVAPVEHDGSTCARITGHNFPLSFPPLEPTPIFAPARAEGYSAKSASVALDDQPLGTLGFHRQQI